MRAGATSWGRADPAGNIKPDKAKSTGRIDLLVAIVMAIGGSIASPEAPEQNLDEIYTTEPPLYV